MRALVVLLAACGFNNTVTGGSKNNDADSSDAGVDARMLDGCTTFSTIVDTCQVGDYGPMLSITGSRKYDTTTHVLSDPNGNNPSTPMFFETTIDGAPITLLVVDGFRIENGGSLRVVGTRAFGVVSTGAVEITGLLNGAGTPDQGGAGARSQGACGMSAGRDGNDHDGVAGGGASGGSGAGFATAGAKGGTGDNNQDRIVGPDGGIAGPMPTGVIGGCPGGGGGDQSLVGNGRTGGDGGAGIFITSAAAIAVSGDINVGGGGGRGGGAIDAGGAGGGSGGMVLVEASSVMVSGAIAANGGAGGGGATTNSGGDGMPGQASAMAAAGGTAPNNAGTGGVGGAMAQPTPPQPGDANAGGGGGGGGVGYVFVKTASPMISGTISPGTSVWP